MPKFGFTAKIRNHTTGTSNGGAKGTVTAADSVEAKTKAAAWVREKGREKGQVVTPHDFDVYPQA